MPFADFDDDNVRGADGHPAQLRYDGEKLLSSWQIAPTNAATCVAQLPTGA